MPTKRRRARQRTLAIDVGGSGVKCALLDPRGEMASERLREDTPERFTPAQLVALIVRMAKQMPRYDRVAVAAIRGEGVEMVITLGTGLGTALFIDGVLSAHYQTLPEQEEPFSRYGDAARRQIGRKRWERRVHDLFDQLRWITNYDRLYVGGGNAERIRGEMPSYVTRIDSAAGIRGGHRLWEWGDVP